MFIIKFCYNIYHFGSEIGSLTLCKDCMHKSNFIKTIRPGELISVIIPEEEFKDPWGSVRKYKIEGTSIMPKEQLLNMTCDTCYCALYDILQPVNLTL